MHVCFGTNDKFHSKLIRKITESKWSHAWLEFECKGELLALQSGFGGVEIYPAKKIRKEYPKHIIYRNEFDPSNGFKWGFNHLGYGYDYGVIVNAIILILFKLTKWKWLWKILLKNASKFSCSEFACLFLQKCEIQGLDKYEAEFTTPFDLSEFCEKSKDFKVVLHWI